MKFIVTIVLMLLSTACVHAEDWKKTKSQEGNFQVLMPIDAEYSTLEVETDIGVVKTDLFQSFNNDGKQVFMVTYSDYGQEIFKTKISAQILKGAMENTYKNGKGELLSHTDIRFGDYPGKEYLILKVNKGTKIYLHWRIVLKDDRLYQIGALSVDQKMPTEIVKKYRDSFSLLR